jgi:hypothetical protein
VEVRHVLPVSGAHSADLFPALHHLLCLHQYKNASRLEAGGALKVTAEKEEVRP